MEKSQKTQKTWEEEYARGDLSPWALWKRGFRPRSNKYRGAILEYKYYGRHYYISLTLSHADYDELKECPYREEQEHREEAERAEYERFLYLQEKFGKEKRE